MDRFRNSCAVSDIESIKNFNMRSGENSPEGEALPVIQQSGQSVKMNVMSYRQKDSVERLRPLKEMLRIQPGKLMPSTGKNSAMDHIRVASNMDEH